VTGVHGARSVKVRRVSDFFHLGATQPFLDFVDVDVYSDTEVFFDPTALLGLPSPWAHECIGLIQDFFQHVLGLIEKGCNREALGILQHLREPNETHLGLSRGRARGRGLGPKSAQRLWHALRSSAAAKSGLLRDLEDTILMVEGVAADIVSDIATNIVRLPLVLFTQDRCRELNIPMEPGIAVGPLWDPGKHAWYAMHTPMPMTPTGPLLLIPKVLVRRKLEYDVDEYLHKYLLPFLEEQEIAAKTAIVTVLKSGPKVTRKALVEKYGGGKATVVEQTRLHPEVLERYRRAKREAEAVRRPPLGLDELADAEATPLPDWDALLSRVLATPVGNSAAAEYHDAIFHILRVLLYPLTNARKEVRVHDGRKRIDVVFENAAADGFFWWVGQHYPAAYVFVECKNFGRELGNPELDQIAGRFSPSRGQFGIVVCRSLEDPEAFARRCRDTADDGRGFLLAVTDEDLTGLVDAARLGGYPARQFLPLRLAFDALVL
jgi:hypothetical protein